MQLKLTTRMRREIRMQREIERERESFFYSLMLLLKTMRIKSIKRLYVFNRKQTCSL